MTTKRFWIYNVDTKEALCAPNGERLFWDLRPSIGHELPTFDLDHIAAGFHTAAARLKVKEEP